MNLAYCQLGYRRSSPKLLSLAPGLEAAASMPERIPFYVHGLFDRMQRDAPVPAAWNPRFFRWPYDLGAGRILPDNARVAFRGELVLEQSRWGPVWKSQFDAFSEPGNFQVETDFASSFPFTVADNLYDRLQWAFLEYLRCQRSGFDLPGIRAAEHLDDGVLDSTGEQIAAAGGWYDAGDLRKWLFLTQPNLSALARIAERGHPGLRARAVEEISWGNRFFHSMQAPSGQVWEDLAGGTFKVGLDMEKDWWFENHPGCNADNGGCFYTDNKPGTGDERPIRTSYNPAVQFMFVRTQCEVSRVLAGAEAARCVELALRAWRFGRDRGHDSRTLFLAEELLAAIELSTCMPGEVATAMVADLATRLMQRQDAGTGGLEGYFTEKDSGDGFRCIALSCEPAFALLRLVETRPRGLEALVERARMAISRYVDKYLLADAASNPFGIGPYGVYVSPPSRDLQVFRDAGRGRGVRTFIHPFNPQQIVHGTGSVVTHQAALCARAGDVLGRADWKVAAEVMVQWTLGHNPQALSLHTGVGFRHPTPFSIYVPQIPNAMCVGHIGRPDDSPYLEASPLIEWCTQEIWDVVHGHLVHASLYIS